MSKISSQEFYEPWHGHETSHIRHLVDYARSKQQRICFLVGDSSLDNKYWVNGKVDAVNGYEDILKPPKSVPDVAFHLNHFFQKHKIDLFAINAAVEATTLGERSSSLWPQDEVVRDSITKEDILICSIGGNDIALAPSLSTIFNIIGLIYFSSTASIASGGGLGLSHFIDMFRTKTQQYLSRLCAKNTPPLILPSMIYFPCEISSSSWAETSLKALGYNSDPVKLQTAIESMFRLATSRIEIPGASVVPIPLFKALDPKNGNDYVARVEPSEEGGRKMAELYGEAILKFLSNSS